MEISSGNLLLTALDHRAATFEKLGKLQAALRDSKQMIDLKPELSKVLDLGPFAVQALISMVGLPTMCENLAVERRNGPCFENLRTGSSRSQDWDR